MRLGALADAAEAPSWAPLGRQARTSFARCVGPLKSNRLRGGLGGLPCRGNEEESCNEVHAACARVPHGGTEPDGSDLRFNKPKPPCAPEEGDGSAADGPGNAGKMATLAKKAQKAADVAGAAAEGDLSAAKPSTCNARMIDMPYGLQNPEASDKGISTTRALRGSQKAVNQKLPLTVWGMAVHGLSGTWAFDSHGKHAADYVYEVPQGRGAPSDFYLCDSRWAPQHCALLGGNLRHSCAEMYDPRQCDYCEDKGDSLVCTVRGWNGQHKKWVRVPIYPRDLLGELYRGEWRDVFARPLWASVELRKADLRKPIRRLPDYMLGPGPAAKVFIPGPPRKTPPWLIKKAAAAFVVPPPSPEAVLGDVRRRRRGRTGGPRRAAADFL